MTINLTAAMFISTMAIGLTPPASAGAISCRNLFDRASEPRFVSTAEEQEAEHTRMFEAFELASPGGQTAFSVSSSETTAGYIGRQTYRSRQLFLMETAKPEIIEIVASLGREFGIKEFRRSLDLTGSNLVHRPEERGYRISQVTERVGGTSFSLDISHEAMSSDSSLEQFLRERLEALRKMAAAKEHELTLAAMVASENSCPSKCVKDASKDMGYEDANGNRQNRS